MERSEEILRFWFGEPVGGQPVPSRRRRLWFGGDAATDRRIAEAFAADVERAAAGEYRPWRRSPRSALALILLVDQFPRNIHRGTGRAYACDGQALDICRRGLEADQDRSLDVVQRAFFYLPLEHAEDRDAQRRSVELFSRLCRQAPPEHADLCRSFLEYAERHRQIIERFGRFPHRNAALGRPTTPAEEAFLRQPGSSF